MSSTRIPASQHARRRRWPLALAVGRAVLFGSFYPPVAASVGLFTFGFAIQTLTGVVTNPAGADYSPGIFMICVLFSGALGAPLGILCALLGLWALRVWSRSLDAGRVRQRLVTLGHWLGLASAIPIITAFELEHTGLGVVFYAVLGALVGALGGYLLPHAVGPLPPARRRPRDASAEESQRVAGWA